MKKILIVCLALSAFFSCKKDDPITPGKYGAGLLILNEGPFGTGSGTIGFWDRSDKAPVNDVFETENTGAKLGNILQSMTQSGEKFYFVVNNSNKVVVTDKNFKYLSEISGLQLPRYLVVKGSKAYISQWGSDGLTGSLVVADLATGQLTKTIPLGKGPENMLIKGDKLYVSMVGGYDRDNRVMVVDLVGETVSKTITVDDNPSNIIDYNGQILVLCKGFTDYVNPANSTNGKIVEISNDAVSATYNLSEQADNLIRNGNSSTLYFTLNGKPSKWEYKAANFETLQGAPFIYKLSYDDVAGKVLMSDAVDFASKGKILVADENLNVSKTIDAGIIPSLVYVIK